MKLCNLVSKVPVCMADQTKLLASALQCKRRLSENALNLNGADLIGSRSAGGSVYLVVVGLCELLIG